MSCLQEQFPPAEEERKTTERAEESGFKAVVCFCHFLSSVVSFKDIRNDLVRAKGHYFLKSLKPPDKIVHLFCSYFLLCLLFLVVKRTRLLCFTWQRGRKTSTQFCPTQPGVRPMKTLCQAWAGR